MTTKHAEHLRDTGNILQDDGVRIFDRFTDTDGLVIQRAEVWDESMDSVTLPAMQQAIADADRDLIDHPDWKAPMVKHQVQDGVKSRVLVPQNAASEWVYMSPAMNAWRTHLVPTAHALYPIQYPYEPTLPDADHTPIDPIAASFFLDARDSIGIRTRARIMRSIVERNIDDNESMTWVSVACGAAVPVLESLKSLKERDIRAELILIDYDLSALKFAAELAAKQDLVEGTDFTLMPRNIIKSLIQSDEVITEIGEGSIQMVDLLGIIEYLDDEAAAALLKQSYRLVKADGSMVFGNMMSSRSELDFNQRGIGWPRILPRSLEELRALLITAEIPMDHVTITIPEDGIYAVVEVKK